MNKKRKFVQPFLEYPRAGLLFGKHVYPLSRGVVSKVVAFSLCFVIGVAALPGQTLLRFPNTHGDQVVFEAHDNLWTARVSGGQATQVTCGFAHDLMPRFSPNGRWIAFTRRDQGSEDVYIVSAQGGQPRRLTYRSSRPGGPGPTFIPDDNLVVTWTPDSQNIVFLSRRMSFNWSELRLFQVPVGGGYPTPLPLGHAGLMTFGPDGHTVAFTRNFSDFQTRKRYDGGLAPDIYTYNLVTKHSVRITDWKGTDTAPMWVGRKMYFLSDRDQYRRANLWVYDLESKAFRQVTHFSDYDIDMPSLGDQSISFQQGGKLYVMSLPSEAVREVQVQVPDDGAHTKERNLVAGNFIRESDTSGPDFAISPLGDLVVFSARGDLFQIRQAKGLTDNLTLSSNADEDHPTFSPDGKTLAYTSDETGEQQVMLRSVADGAARSLTHFKATYFFRPVWSPDGKNLAVSSSEKELWLVPAKGGEPHMVARDPNGVISDATFSPDGRWLAFSTRRTTQNRCLHLYEIASAIDTVVSSPMNSDFAPAFSMDGKWLFFASDRRELAVFSKDETNVATLKTSGVYAAGLDRDVQSPMGFSATDAPVSPAGQVTSLLLTELMERVVPLTSSASDITSVNVRGARIFYGTKRANTFGDDLPGDKDAIHVFDLVSKTDQVVLEDGGESQLSQDGTKVVYERGGDWYTADAVAAHPHELKLTLGTMHARVDPRHEWEEMFNNAWRLERDIFFDPTMEGNDWKGIHDRYARLLPLLGSRDDLNYLIGQIQGELASSHMFVLGGEDLAPTARRATLLGADYTLDASSGRYRIAKIYHGDNSRPEYVSPLTTPGLNVTQDDYLLSVNGREVKAPVSPDEALLGLQDPVTLEIASSADGPRRVIVVQPLRSEFSLREQDWIDKNRARVERESSGKVGYIYLSDFYEKGTLQFFRQFHSQFNKQALIIDERWNAGGNTSQWVLDRLRRRVAGGFMSRAGGLQTLPDAVAPDSQVTLINEFSASDGDQFAYYFQKEGLGELIGTRTWGGVRGMGDDPSLLDGGRITVPHNALFGADGEWLIENTGVQPDINVEDPIGETNSGTNDQLGVAIKVLLQSSASSLKPAPPTAAKLPAYPAQGEVPPAH